MKPIDLKEVAKQYTKKYYPQWLSRVDRIWDMFEKTSPNQVVDNVVKSGFQQGGALGIDGQQDPQLNECISGIAILAFTHQSVRDEDGSVSDEKISVSHIGPEVSEDVQKELKSVLAEMLAINKDSTQSVMEKKESVYHEPPEYLAWYKDTEPSGIPLDMKTKKRIVNNDKKKHDLLIVLDETVTSVYLSGSVVEPPPGKMALRILCYILRNRGAGGTAWNLAKQVWDISFVKQFGDLRELLKAVERNKQIEEARREAALNITKGDVAKLSNLVSRRIGELNRYFEDIELKARIDAENSMDEYKFSDPIEYCLIQKVSSDF